MTPVVVKGKEEGTAGDGGGGRAEGGGEVRRGRRRKVKGVRRYKSIKICRRDCGPWRLSNDCYREARL